MIINHNMSAMYANRTLGNKTSEIKANIEKLSSGMRINKAGDDASGLAVSEKMRGQIRGLNQAERNIQSGVSFIQATEGYLQETQDILHRIRELSVQSANGIYSPEDRGQIQVEVSQLVDEVNRIASHAQFNGMNMLLGEFSKGKAGISLHIGANANQNATIFIGTMTAGALGLDGGQNGKISISTTAAANKAIASLDTALGVVSGQRANLGAYQNRFEMAQKGVSIAAENLQAAESQIRDANMANEMVDFVKNSILQNAGTSMLAQANTQPQSVLKLLG